MVASTVFAGLTSKPTDSLCRIRKDRWPRAPTASSESLLRLPGGGTSLSQVMSPSPPEAMAFASVLVSDEPAYGTISNGSHSASGGSVQEACLELVVIFPSPNVHDPAHGGSS